jgi:hypothetical protein
MAVMPIGRFARQASTRIRRLDHGSFDTQECNRRSGFDAVRCRHYLASVVPYSDPYVWGTHQYWKSFSVLVNGEPATGVITQVGNYASAAILLLHGQVDLLATGRFLSTFPESIIHFGAAGCGSQL